MNRLVMMAAAALAAGAAISDGGAWDPDEPVTTYWYGPGCPGTNHLSLAMTDAWARQLKEGGFNTVWARNPEELDIAAKHGLRVIYSVDPTTVWAKVDLDDSLRAAGASQAFAGDPVCRDKGSGAPCGHDTRDAFRGA